ncbi:MAG TPA: VWA domain-containing protein [Bryobacteraceae bacterium]|nr:VWA domain-containing protein [Bryobacteraceae bacterium]
MRPLLGCVLIAAAWGQQAVETFRSTPHAKPETVIDRKPNIRVDTTLVLIPVSVLDPIGRYIISLERENFKVYEDKVEQEITQFSDEDAPLSMGIVFDTSGSMGSKLSKSRQAVRQVLKTANPEDEFFLVQFNDRPELTMPFTIDIREIQSRLMYSQSKGRTALLDGVYMAMNQMKKARNPRKAILIISDGGDNSSRYTETEVKKNVREGDVQIFAMGIFEPMGSRGRTSEEMGGPALLGDLAVETGGRHFEVGNLAELPDVAEKIALALRKQYVLGYTPKNAVRDGKYRRVQVRLARTSGLGALRAIFRTGYYAPTD